MPLHDNQQVQQLWPQPGQLAMRRQLHTWPLMHHMRQATREKREAAGQDADAERRWQTNRLPELLRQVNT
jgi:hypothetical protein